MREQIQLVEKVMIKAIKRVKAQNPVTIFLLFNMDRQTRPVYWKESTRWSPVKTERSYAHCEWACFFERRGTSISNVICLPICLHLVLICPSAEKPKTTFYCYGQTASSFGSGMIKWLASSSLGRSAFHFQLVQSSLTRKSVTFHLGNENFTTGDRLGQVFVGKALNLGGHLTCSQGHLPLSCLATVV